MARGLRIRFPSTDRTILANPGQLALSGQNVGLRVHRRLLAARGTHALTGREVNFSYSGAGGGSVTAVVTPSRTSGPAPLMVHFDGTDTTADVDDEFREIGCAWNFGDSGSGTFSLTGNSRNVSRGAPIAAHLYRTPGTYTMKMRARDSSGGPNDGDTDQVNIDITATNPDDHWPGTQTISLSRNTTHTGAPAGATLISNVTSWPTWANNRRYLLQKGQDYRSLGALNLIVGGVGAQNVRIDTIGTGARPLVGRVRVNGDGTIGDFFGADYTDWGNNIDIIGLHATGFYNLLGCTTLMFLDCYLDDPVDETFNIAGAWDYAQSTTDIPAGALFRNPAYIYIVDCDADATNSADGTMWFDGVAYAVVQNTRIDHTGQHNMRAAMMYKSIVDNCHFPGHIRADASRLCFKIHGNGLNANRALTTWTTRLDAAQRSKYVVFRDGILGSTDGNYMTTAGFARQNETPENPEHIEDAICEGATFVRCSLSVFDWGRTGNRITTRGCSVQGGGTLSSYEIFEPWAPEYGGPYYDNEPAIEYSDPV